MSSMEGRTVFSRIPYLLDNYEPRKSISMEGKSINSDRVTPDSSHGPWFPIPQMQYNQQEIEEFKKLEKGDTTPPNFISFMYEYNRAYPDNYCDNAIMVNLQTKKHSPMDIETLHTFGTKLNFKTRSYTYRNSVPDLHNMKKEEAPTHSTKNFNSTLQPTPKNLLSYTYWVDICDPNSLQMELLERSFGIHTLTTEDILSPSTREKQEEYPNYLYIVLNEIEPVVGRGHFYDTQNIHILLFPNMIFSIHKKRLKFFPLVLYQFLFETTEEVSVDWVLYKLLDSNVKEIVSLVDSVQKEVAILDKTVDKFSLLGKGVFMKRMGAVRQLITRLRGEFLSKREVLSYIIAEFSSIFIQQNTKIFFRDVQDNIKLLVERLEMSYEMLSNTNNTYLAMISLDQSVTNHKIGEVMKCFGAVTTIVLPITIITGIWGMNVQVPLQFGISPATLDWFNLLVVGFTTWIIIAVIIFRYNRCM